MNYIKFKNKFESIKEYLDYDTASIFGTVARFINTFISCYKECLMDELISSSRGCWNPVESKYDSDCVYLDFDEVRWLLVDEPIVLDMEAALGYYNYGNQFWYIYIDVLTKSIPAGEVVNMGSAFMVYQNIQSIIQLTVVMGIIFIL